MSSGARAPVVVGADGSARGTHAVGIAAAEAARRHRPLRIVHVLAPPRGDPGAAREQARIRLAEAARAAARAAPGVATTTDLITGRPADVLTGLSGHADLLVVGENGTGGLLLGSVVRHVVTHTAGPVLVVRGTCRSTGPVVVGIDGTEKSAGALDFALDEAARRGTSLVALHAWNGNDWTELNSGLPMTYEFWSGEAQEERVLAEALAGAAGRYPDIPVRRQVVRGPAGSMLAGWSHHAQLVVVGEHRGGPGPMLGSVGRHLVFHADCPTTVVPTRPAG